MSQPRKTGLPHAPTRGFGAPVFGLACYKIEIENSLEMALFKAKSGGAWQSHCRPLQQKLKLHFFKQPGERFGFQLTFRPQEMKSGKAVVSAVSVP